MSEVTTSPVPIPADDQIQIAVGVPGHIRKISVPRGATVSDVLKAASMDLPREEGWELRLSPWGRQVPNGGHRVDLNDTIYDESVLLLLHAIVGRAKITR